MDLITVTEKSDPELFQQLKENCDFDCSHVPKHGSGYVTPRTELIDGRKFECEEMTWDYSWGIEWEYTNPMWTQVKEFEKTCPCCGQSID